MISVFGKLKIPLSYSQFLIDIRLFCSKMTTEVASEPTTKEPHLIKGPLKSIHDVEIDGHGVFKYVLIKVYEKMGARHSKIIIRGNKRASFHNDIYESVADKIEKDPTSNLATECVGGGRINHDATNKTILVYGYSQAFGRADHKIAVQLLEKVYKDYKVSYSNEGY